MRSLRCFGLGGVDVRCGRVRGGAVKQAMTIRLDPVVHAALVKAAKDDDRTAAQMAQRLILAGLSKPKRRKAG